MEAASISLEEIQARVTPEWLEKAPERDKRDLLRIVEYLREKKEGEAISRYDPYAKQAEFHAAGAKYQERLLMAANQSGKTFSGAAEVAIHLTGLYPSWWEGWTHRKPQVWWAASESMAVSAGGIQRLLLGREGTRGTGAIPAESIIRLWKTSGVPGSVDMASVRHSSGGTSLIVFKSFDAGRTKFQGETIDGIWFDEEPPEDVYMEGLTRCNVSKGPVITTFTPMKGVTSLVKRFKEPHPQRIRISMTLWDVDHYDEARREEILSQYPEYQRHARAYGVPMVGAGLVFPIDLESIKIDPFDLPKHWPRIGGIDFGWTHPTAAAHLAHDRDTDTVYLYHGYRAAKQPISVHTAAIKAVGDWIPIAWPHDGENKTASGSGISLAKQYKEAGLRLTAEKAHYMDATVGNSVEAGLADMYDRMLTGRFKVFRSVPAFFEEALQYHRDEKGVLVKEEEDLICAARYGLMMLREAALPPNQNTKIKRKRSSWRT